MTRVPSAEEIKDANTRYHDVAAAGYDTKWGIDYGRGGRVQVVAKLAKALGHPPGRFGRSLEIGAGTGYFTLNLLQAGVIEHAVATDISPGMLAALGESARRLGLAVERTRCEAAELPFPDASFDLVFGHAVLHHLPDLRAAFAEFERVLRPGGTIAFCGEPSRHGDRIATVPKRAAMAVAPAWRRLMGAPPRRPLHADGGAAVDCEAAEHALEWQVDVHAFAPGELRAFAEGAGLAEVRVGGEELAAGIFGWTNRTLESTAEPEGLPRLWFHYAHRGYLALQRVDRRLLEPRFPAALFYNLLLSARKPARRAYDAAAAR